MPELLLADVGSTFTKVCVVHTDEPRLLARAAVPTTTEPDVNQGLDAACRLAGTALDTALPLLASSSAAGGLRIAAVGLVPSLTAKAAEMAALGAGAKVVGTFPYALNTDDGNHLRTLEPDLVLLTGGTDGGDTSHIVGNAEVITRTLPAVPVVVAGNRNAHDDLRRVLDGHQGPVRFADNVMPELNRLNLGPSRDCIRQLFLERIVIAKGMGRLKARADLLVPTPQAVLEAVRLLGQTAGGLGDFLAVDIGGATTDVYSHGAGLPSNAGVVYKGLPEPIDKRTVEADLGMRHTLSGVMALIDLEGLCAEHGLQPEEVMAWTTRVAADPGAIPHSTQETAADTALAAAACRLAVQRHCGRLEEVWGPEGRVFLQEGKDLGDAGWVVGTGGPAAFGPAPEVILAAARRRAGSASLLPRAPRFLADRDYLLWAVGLLAQAGLDEAGARLALHHLREVPGGDAPSCRRVPEGTHRGE
mgnify:CR=1 FL=1